MTVTQERKFPPTQLDELLAPYIPPQDTWNPADESLYKPTDLYRVPLDEARDMQLKAIKYTFTHHYNNNDFYHKYCDLRDIRPDNIKTSDDLNKIPLIPDTTFKQYPSGVDFARWLANIFTGDLPTIFLESDNPTFDEVINAFNAAGLYVWYSSGTSGRHTVIPRDRKAYSAILYAYCKLESSMVDMSANHLLLLFPTPTQTNMGIGKAMAIKFDIYDDVYSAFDYDITSQLVQRVMSEDKVRDENKTERRDVTSIDARKQQKMIVDNAIRWLERYDNTKDTIALTGPPFLLLDIMNTLERDHKRFDFGERGLVETSGGWKVHKNVRIPQKDFRNQIQDVLGIPETGCIDAYNMIESTGISITCPEGHYYHIPYTYFKPVVLDKSLTPVEYGEWGRFAFLDASAQSYPGFVISGDWVRMFEHCPVCDRPGPVLDREIERAKGEEVRGCAEQLRRILAEDLGRL